MRLIIFLILVFLPFMSFPQTIFENEDVTVSKLKEDTFVFETWDKTTMYLLTGSERSLLIDTGTKCDSLDRIIKTVTDKPVDVVITHAHPDHAGCIGYFDSIYMHPADTVVDLDVVKNYCGEIIYVNDGDFFDLGGKTIEVLHTPGHTPGSITLIDKGRGDAYTGDSFGSGSLWLQCEPVMPVNVFLQSCDRFKSKMAEDNIREIWCGHYPYRKSSLDLQYIKTIERIAARLANNDQSGSEPFTHPVIATPPTARKLTVDGCTIVYDSAFIH